MTTDELIGKNVRAMREAGGLSQDLTAHDMQEVYGHTTWRRQTVIRTEQGKRSLKLAEAVDLASYLNCSVDDFTKER